MERSFEPGIPICNPGPQIGCLSFFLLKEFAAQGGFRRSAVVLRTSIPIRVCATKNRYRRCSQNEGGSSAVSFLARPIRRVSVVFVKAKFISPANRPVGIPRGAFSNNLARYVYVNFTIGPAYSVDPLRS